MSFAEQRPFVVEGGIVDARLEDLAETISAVGVDVDDLDAPVVIQSVAIPGDETQTETSFYAAVNALIATSETLTPVPARAILGDPQITGFPLVAFTREATALHDYRFREAVEQNPAIRGARVANRALLACRIDAPPESNSVSKAAAIVNTEHGAQITQGGQPSRNWRTRLGAIDFISSGQLLVSELEQTPPVHYTLVGSRHVALQQEHAPGATKTQWLLDSASLVTAIANTVPGLVKRESFIRPLDVYTALNATFDDSTVDCVRDAVEADAQAAFAPESDVRTVLVGAGILDSATSRPVEDAARAWIDAVISI